METLSFWMKSEKVKGEEIFLLSTVKATFQRKCAYPSSSCRKKDLGVGPVPLCTDALSKLVVTGQTPRT